MLKTKLHDQHYYAAQNSNFSETGSYFMEKIASSFPSDVLGLLSLNSVLRLEVSKKQQTKAGAEQHCIVSVFCPNSAASSYFMTEVIP